MAEEPTEAFSPPGPGASDFGPLGPGDRVRVRLGGNCPMHDPAHQRPPHLAEEDGRVGTVERVHPRMWDAHPYLVRFDAPFQHPRGGWRVQASIYAAGELER